MDDQQSEFEHYERLLADIETLSEQLRARFLRQLNCQLGCTGCCHQHLTLSQVEADFVAAAVRQLPGEVQTRVAAAAAKLKAAPEAGEPLACPLLDGAGCAIYRSRPVICRTHGFPIIFQAEQSEEYCLDVCPLNFSAPGELESLRAPDTINIDRVNLRLAAVNYAYCRDHKGDGNIANEPRRTMADIVLMALAEKK